MELSKEHFYKGLENLGKRLDDLPTNADLAKQTEELKDYVHQSFEAQQMYMEERFKEIIDMLDVRNELRLLSLDVVKIKQILHLTES